MQTVCVAIGLAAVGVLDAMFAGFRASCGRTGLVMHRRADTLALRRGLTLGLALAAPIAIVVLADSIWNDRTSTYADAGSAMLAVYAPYAGLVLLALGAYGTLHWRRRFLASALLLGPLTLIRPVIAIAGALAAALVTSDLRVAVLAAAAVAAVLAVEPLAGKRWYAEPNVGGLSRGAERPKGLGSAADR